MGSRVESMMLVTSHIRIFSMKVHVPCAVVLISIEAQGNPEVSRGCIRMKRLGMCGSILWMVGVCHYNSPTLTNYEGA